jgi:hypothetical protein
MSEILAPERPSYEYDEIMRVSNGQTIQMYTTGRNQGSI